MEGAHLAPNFMHLLACVPLCRSLVRDGRAVVHVPTMDQLRNVEAGAFVITVHRASALSARISPYKHRKVRTGYQCPYPGQQGEKEFLPPSPSLS